jgi:hypothetical protein
LERVIWKTLVASQKLPFESHASATSGQFLWTLLNQEVDWDERKSRVHPWCIEELESSKVTCEVCHKEFDPEAIQRVRDEYGDQIYRPGDDMSDFENMTEQEKTDYEKEIEEAFKTAEETK